MKYAVEFIGTFFLMFVVALAAVFGQGGALAGIAIGSILMVMIYAGGHISGGHYNPAVSTGVAVRGKATYVDMAIYWGVQIVGALAAALLAAALYKGAVEVAPLDLADPNRGGTVGAVVIEFLFTFALVWVVLNVATSKDTAGNSFYGLAIGFTVAAGAYAGGFYSAGAFNPAVSVGLGILGVLGWGTVAIYVVTQLVAGAVAAFAFRYLSANDSKPDLPPAPPARATPPAKPAQQQRRK
jgi:aquaporin Z